MGILDFLKPKHNSLRVNNAKGRSVLSKEFSSDTNPENWIDILTKEKKHFSLELLEQICDEVVNKHFRDESNVLHVQSPITVVGDIHGQFYDLLNLFQIADPKNKKSFLFLGDYVDRGEYSILTMTLLIVLKLRYPSRFTIIRGNHESRVMSELYGFETECNDTYGTTKALDLFCNVFKHLPIAATIDKKYFCCHGGLSNHFFKCEDLEKFSRVHECPEDGPQVMFTLLWDDPHERKVDYKNTPRGATSWGLTPTNNFLKENNFTHIIRAHQSKMEGYEYNHEGKVLTIFSAPNYCGHMKNLGAYAEISSSGISIQKFKPIKLKDMAINPFLKR